MIHKMDWLIEMWFPECGASGKRETNPCGNPPKRALRILKSLFKAWREARFPECGASGEKENVPSWELGAEPLLKGEGFRAADHTDKE